MSKKKEDVKAEDGDKEVEKPIVAKSLADIQRLKLMKLMKNPDKPVVIPERPKSKSNPLVPEFVRNVMGSSAGAGSGEFHVYRHLRRKEYARQKFIQEKSKKELLDEEYQKKLEENKRKADELTAKKRAKRLKKKQRQKQSKKQKTSKNDSQSEKNESSSDEANDSDDEKSSTHGNSEKSTEESEEKNEQAVADQNSQPDRIESNSKDNSND